MTELSSPNPCANPEAIDHLNRECFCLSLDEAALHRAMEEELGTPGLYDLVRERCPHLFSARPVFVAPHHLTRMAAVIRAVETVIALPAWRELVLAGAPAIARHHPRGAKGVFFGYDFHVAGDRFGLIEINTNAGGALLNAVLARAQIACCPEVAALVPTLAAAHRLETDIVAMFRNEWRLANRERPLRTIAIVDANPSGQYLYPEFLLFRQLFRNHGFSALIASPEELEFRDGVLRRGDERIDLVYNRLTDFLLDAPPQAALKQAWLDGAVVLTPHPQAHALYADKRNLALLSNPVELATLGVPENIRELLVAGIPTTEIVDVAQAERLWSERRKLFFKPAAGYGSRAAWRGDKITRRVWEEILAGGYVAQALVQPGERLAGPDGAFKFDLRNYAYDGTVQWVAARIYQGQTTNFRTPGGGFAPVYTCSDLSV
jgi:hypothetical protein